MEIGIDSFAAILPSPTTGIIPSATDRMAGLLEEVEVADRVGLDVFGIGEGGVKETAGFQLLAQRAQAQAAIRPR